MASLSSLGGFKGNRVGQQRWSEFFPSIKPGQTPLAFIRHILYFPLPLLVSSRLYLQPKKEKKRSPSCSSQCQLSVASAMTTGFRIYALTSFSLQQTTEATTANISVFFCTFFFVFVCLNCQSFFLSILVLYICLFLIIFLSAILAFFDEGKIEHDQVSFTKYIFGLLFRILTASDLRQNVIRFFFVSFVRLSTLFLQ